MNTCPGCGWLHESGRLADVLWRLAEGLEDAASLPDHVVIVLDGWSDGDSPVIRAEAERRQALYAELARRFAAAGREGLDQ